MDGEWKTSFGYEKKKAKLVRLAGLSHHHTRLDKEHDEQH
jgi:hypothetical protein